MCGILFAVSSENSDVCKFKSLRFFDSLERVTLTLTLTLNVIAHPNPNPILSGMSSDSVTGWVATTHIKRSFCFQILENVLTYGLGISRNPLRNEELRDLSI